MELLLRFPELAPAHPRHKTGLRRVVGIPDMEGKTRIVAICDYWSQTALYPVHQFMFRCLRRIPQDVTFNQGSFVEIVKS